MVFGNTRGPDRGLSDFSASSFRRPEKMLRDNLNLTFQTVKNSHEPWASKGSQRGRRRCPGAGLLPHQDPGYETPQPAPGGGAGRAGRKGVARREAGSQGSLPRVTSGNPDVTRREETLGAPKRSTPPLRNVRSQRRPMTSRGGRCPGRVLPMRGARRGRCNNGGRGAGQARGPRAPPAPARLARCRAGGRGDPDPGAGAGISEGSPARPGAARRRYLPPCGWAAAQRGSAGPGSPPTGGPHQVPRSGTPPPVPSPPLRGPLPQPPRCRRRGLSRELPPPRRARRARKSRVAAAGSMVPPGPGAVPGERRSAAAARQQQAGSGRC